MYKSLLWLPIALLGSGLHAAEAEEFGRVISSRPVIHQVQTPQRVCGNLPVTVTEPKTGAGAALGAVAGGVLGSTIGRGSGNAAATALGVIGGAVLGDNLEGQNTVVQSTATCSTQLVTQSVTVYEVEYEYAGKRYRAELPSDPGKSLPVSVSPALTAAPEPYPPAPAYDPNVATFPAQVVAPPVMPAPVYVTPYPYPYYGYPYGYYPPLSIRWSIGYPRGGHRR